MRGIQVFMIIMLIFLGSCGDSTPKDVPPPTDQELIEVFQENRELFEEIVSLVSKYEYIKVSIRFSYHKPETIDMGDKVYIEQFLKKINAYSLGICNKEVRICVWACGDIKYGDYKGYIYTPTPYSVSVQSLDNFTSSGRNESLVRSIGDGWYLYYAHFL